MIVIERTLEVGFDARGADRYVTLGTRDRLAGFFVEDIAADGAIGGGHDLF
jgi:hypothetical protein